MASGLSIAVGGGFDNNGEEKTGRPFIPWAEAVQSNSLKSARLLVGLAK